MALSFYHFSAIKPPDIFVILGMDNQYSWDYFPHTTRFFEGYIQNILGLNKVTKVIIIKKKVTKDIFVYLI